MRFSLGNLRGFRQHALTLPIFELEKGSFFFKQVRILPEIDGHHYQSANVAPTAKVRHWIVTEPYLPECHSISYLVYF